MKPYIGTKRIEAKPESRTDPETGRELPGYAVKYGDGYTSWSPKDVFEKHYRDAFSAEMDFGHAINIIRDGGSVSRAGWNKEGMSIFLADDVPGMAPFIAINTGDEVRPWLASQADMLADDWFALPKVENDIVQDLVEQLRGEGLKVVVTPMGIVAHN